MHTKSPVITVALQWNVLCMVYNTKDNCIEFYVFKYIARPVSSLSICKGMLLSIQEGGAWPLQEGGLGHFRKGGELGCYRKEGLGHYRKGGAWPLREGEDLAALGRGCWATPRQGALSTAGRGLWPLWERGPCQLQAEMLTLKYI